MFAPKASAPADNSMNTTQSRQLGWGILGAARIARKNWRAAYHAGNARIVAVASRDPERCRRFVAECQGDTPFPTPPAVLASYEALIASPEVDAVYIPLPTGIRKEWIIRAAEAGKHVLSEKPCGCSAADVREMTEACRRNGVQFMDGVMFMHSERLGRMRAVLDDGVSVGPLRRISASFCAGLTGDALAANIRGSGRLEPFGCLGDLGWYCIRFALWAVNWRMPVEVRGTLLSASGRADDPESVPTEFSAELRFDGGVSAGLYCSFISGEEQWASVTGTLGRLCLSDYVLPFNGPEIAFETEKIAFVARGGGLCVDPSRTRVGVAEHSHGHPTAQEANMFRSFSAQIQSGRLNGLWPEMALNTQIVTDACLKSARIGGAVRLG